MLLQKGDERLYVLFIDILYKAWRIDSLALSYDENFGAE
jgi:hypothetical protein